MAFSSSTYTMLRYLRDSLLLLLLIFGARSVIADWNHIPTGSMKPTLVEGDLVFVNRLAYDLKLPFSTIHLAEWSGPQRGEVVVFDSPADGRLLIKRVIGLPGDRVEMRTNRLFINGEPVTYSSIPPEAFAVLPISEQNASHFASEHLPGRNHLMMVSRDWHTAPNFGPVEVPSDSYLMLGDNRDNSADSRFFGFVPRNAVRGRAVGIIASFDPEHWFLPRSGRLMVGLD